MPISPLQAADIVLSLGKRSPLGKFGGGLAGISLTDLSAHTARAAVTAAGLTLPQVDHFVFATTIPIAIRCLRIGQFVSRQVFRWRPVRLV